MTPIGHARIRAALAALLPQHEPSQAMASHLRPWLDGFAELIVGAERRSAGFITQGTGPAFTEAVQAALAALGMPDAARIHHRLLSSWFQHQGGFVKIEWLRAAEGAPWTPAAACYFRQRPTVDQAVTRLARMGVGPAARELAFDVAQALGRDTLHFVAASFRPDAAVQHKLYFSLLARPWRQDDLLKRLGAVFELVGCGGALHHLRQRHGWNLSPTMKEAVLFASINFNGDATGLSCKLDYPGIAPTRAGLWLVDGRNAAESVAADACALAGTREVSYVGVRFAPGAALPVALKFYCDVPPPGAA